MRTSRFGRFLVACVCSLLLAVPAIAQSNKPKTPAKTGTAPAKTAAPKTAAPKTGDLLDINSATLDQLKALPGIGDVYSGKIVAGRTYARKDQLTSRNIVPQATYDKIKDMIIAKQGSKKK